MKAIVCNEYGSLDDLVLQDTDEPVPADHELLIRVLAAGVNFPDGLLVKGQYQAKPQIPFIPGMELCGEVVSSGSGVSGFKTGDRLISSSVSYGAFAERVALPAASAIKIPKSIKPAEASNLLVAHGTAHHALKQRGNLQAGENLVVLGAAGGTGLAAVQIGKAMGANVIAAASSEEKLALARANGADATINYSTEAIKDAIRQHTDGKGADLIYDPVGGELFDSSVRAMARNGRYLVIGFASGTIPKFPVNLALVKEFSLVGVFWGTFTRKEPAVFAENMQELLDWHQQGRVSVAIDRVFDLKDTPDALKYVMSRQVKGKVAISVS
ncbi:NADPH:quinone oxidoreductase [Chromatiales bacterium (ex Bugula neritina AB1)]|nr:NADPH:quinone oxidoreductase [Chromatiales bacterium (ex Bugula neritina AB1)]